MADSQTQSRAAVEPAEVAPAVRIGRVVSVTGSRISALLGSGSGSAVQELSSRVQVGGIARIPTDQSIVFGTISGLRTENPSFVPDAQEKSFFDIELLGETMRDAASGGWGAFQRGVSILPSLGGDVYTATREDLGRVYARPAGSNVRVGSIHQDQTLPAFVNTDQLLSKHFALVGMSGSGKSCTAALILHAILRYHANGHVILLDPHNEYPNAFRERAEVIAPPSLDLPYWLLNFEESVQVFIGRDGMSREAEVGILKGAILEARRHYAGEGRDTAYITVDTPVPYRITTLIQYLDRQMGRLDNPVTAVPYLRIRDRIHTLQADARYSFMFPPGMLVQDNLAAILSRILRVPVAGKPITILDISGIPSEIIDVVVSMLFRTIFDFAVWTDVSRAVPTLLVCEEAHRYVPKDDVTFASARDAIARVAREGRKYGVGLCLISQRASELSPEVLSQCNTLFALRMTSEADQEFIARSLPDNAAGLIDALPALRTQEAIIIGEAVNVPVRVVMDTLDPDHRPLSGSAPFAAAWMTAPAADGVVEETIHRWRHQSRT